MWLNEEETREEIRRYFKVRYGKDREDDFIHDRAATGELIQELMYETGYVGLFQHSPGWLVCEAGQGLKEFHGREANTMGRAVANAFAFFSKQRCPVAA